jgi:hypothetical protein
VKDARTGDYKALAGETTTKPFDRAGHLIYFTKDDEAGKLGRRAVLKLWHEEAYSHVIRAGLDIFIAVLYEHPGVVPGSESLAEAVRPQHANKLKQYKTS